MMKSRRMRKLVGIACAASIAVGSLAGCGKSDAPSGKEKTQKTAQEVTFPLEESYEFSIMTRAASDSEQDFSKKALVQRAEEATNVTVDWQAIPDEQFNDKFKLALSKSDMPDVVTKMYIKPYDILGYAKKGVFLPIEDYIEKNMPYLTKVLDQRPEVKAAITAADGHIYTLPFINEWSKDSKENINVIGAIPYINVKWLEELNLEMPKTTEELESVLKAFAENIKPDSGEVIPMSFRINQVNQDPGVTLGSFGCGDNTDHYMVTNDKEVYYTLASEEAREGLEWLHELYEGGVIDPEIFSQDASTYSAKLASGRVGLFYEWARESAGDYTEEYQALPPLEGPDGTINVPRQNYYSFDMGVTAITSACENPSVVCAYLDQYFEPSMSIQNCYGTYDDENYTNVFTKDENGMLHWTEEGAADSKVRNDQNLYDTFAILSDYYGVYVDRMLDSDALRFDTVKNVFSPYISSNYNYPAAFMEQDDITRISEIETDLKTYAEQTKADIVKNGITDEKWDEYLKKLDDMGLQELMELKQKGFDMFYELTNYEEAGGQTAAASDTETHGSGSTDGQN